MNTVRIRTLSEQPGAGPVDGLIPLSVPEFRGNEWRYVKECLDTGWVSSVGPFVDRFEKGIAAYTGARYAVAAVNGTAALHIALKAVGLKPDEEVIVSNLTFVAPVNAIRYCQAHPIFVDVDPDTWQIDATKVARFLEEECQIKGGECFNRRSGRRVRAILPVHILGLPCEMDRIVNLAGEYGLLVVEDAAEALGVRFKGQHVGTFGDAGVISFNGNKIITTGGGGVVVTNDPKCAEYVRYLTTQAKDDPLEYFHQEVGYNYRLTNIQAALGVAQLEQLNGFIARKKAIASKYTEALSNLVPVTLMPSPPHSEPTYWLYTILLGPETTLVRRKEVVRLMQDKGVGVRPLWHTIHNLPPFEGCQAYDICHSIRLYERGLSLPCSVGLTDEEQRRCVSVLKDVLRD